VKGVWYISSRWPWISRVVIPRAYSERILSSKPAKRVVPSGTISTVPKSPFNRLLLAPLRVLPSSFPSGECFS
jgi:hypothetical protein